MRLLLLLLPLLALLPSCLPMAAVQGQASVQDPKVVTSLTLEEMEALLKEEGYSYERVRAGERVYFRLRLGDLSAFLILLDCDRGRCESLQLYVGFRMERPPTLERINAWNQQRRFSRAYLDRDGDPFLESDLDLEGGVTRQAIISFLKLFARSLSNFVTWIGLR